MMDAVNSTAAALIEQVVAASEPRDAAAKAAYLKAVPGGYAEGDVVLGVRVPALRAIARGARHTATVDVIDALLDHEAHEVRLLAAILLADRYAAATVNCNGDATADRSSVATSERAALLELLLARADRLNNWDLVDSVAPYTLGVWLIDRSPAERAAVLDPLIGSDLVWRRRLAMVAMLGVIRAGETALPLAVAARLVDDPHALMHKAVGWMLREVGLRDRAALDHFLDAHAATMPRTALRYALEKHDAERRRYFMDARRRH